MSFIKHYSNFNNAPVFSNLLENFFPEFLAAGRDVYGNAPLVNIFETAEYFRLDVAAAGLKKENFKVQVQNNELIIEAQDAENVEDSTEKVLRREFGYNGFRRAFTLPNSVQIDRIEAKYHNGILSVFVPKLVIRKEDNIKEIEIL
ncbi:MAG: Hsp20/alpha crystallin family protein [Thermoflexibacteraceae bacterium]